jgi:hypothetical protein
LGKTPIFEAKTVRSGLWLALAVLVLSGIAGLAVLGLGRALGPERAIGIVLGVGLLTVAIYSFIDHRTRALERRAEAAHREKYRGHRAPPKRILE